jgi:DNA (cytosine-5)-methyltransferase 1
MVRPGLIEDNGVKFRLLDGFCKAGGAGMGYHRAGFEVVGVDIEPQPRYPFEFIQADFLSLDLDFIRSFDAVHASPPCQGYSRTRHLPWVKHKEHPLLIEPVRELLGHYSKLWVIENVGDSPLQGVSLSGGMFGLPFRRLRKFESNILLMAPSSPPEEVGKSGRMFGDRLRKQMDCLDIDWMTRAELSQAIPPAYTEFIGKQLMDYLRVKS